MFKHFQTIRRLLVDDFFKCVWLFSGVGTWRINIFLSNVNFEYSLILFVVISRVQSIICLSFILFLFISFLFHFKYNEPILWGTYLLLFWLSSVLLFIKGNFIIPKTIVAITFLEVQSNTEDASPKRYIFTRVGHKKHYFSCQMKYIFLYRFVIYRNFYYIYKLWLRHVSNNCSISK